MGLTDLIFPRLCVGCNRWGSYLCSNCTQNLTQKDLICPICQRASIGGLTHPLCQKKWGLDGLWSLGGYEGSLKQIIQKLKYRWVSDVAERLVDLMVEYWATQSPVILDQIKKSQGAGWVITPVPLHPKRLKWRGFNQSGLLGQLLAQKIGLEYQEVLVKLKHTQPQVGLKAGDRKNNLKNVFDLSPNQKPLAISYLLIDDVWTTGSTLKECCFVLKKNGAQKVWALTLAR